MEVKCARPGSCITNCLQILTEPSPCLFALSTLCQSLLPTHGTVPSSVSYGERFLKGHILLHSSLCMCKNVAQESTKRFMEQDSIKPCQSNTRPAVEIKTEVFNSEVHLNTCLSHMSWWRLNNLFLLRESIIAQHFKIASDASKIINHSPFEYIHSFEKQDGIICNLCNLS